MFRTTQEVVACLHGNHRLRFLRMGKSRRAFCLGVTGFTNPPIGKVLAACGL